MLAQAEAAPTTGKPSQFTIRPLGPVMGAEVIGLDLGKPISPDVQNRLEKAFLEYRLLCFRDQELSIEQQVAFSKLWGPLLEHTMASHVRDNTQAVQIATNAGPDGKPSGKHPDETAMRWHTDRSWRSNPALATFLYGVEVPKVGGDTLFCNTTMAYDGLPEETKRRIDPMKIIHSVEYSRRSAPNGPPATEYELRIGPPVAHPLARKHPVTGRRAIYAGCHAWKIDGMPEDEGRALIDSLMAHAVQDKFVYRHKWRKHDLVMWDNRCTFHAATPYDTSQELRTMHRTVVEGGPTS